MRFFYALFAFATSTLVLSRALDTPSQVRVATRNIQPRNSSCANSATARDCWGEYSIDTNYYDTTPDTGVTREYWLSVGRVDCAPDGYPASCLAFNGTVPGPTIFADWGDTLTIHVTNNDADNGTSIHWHGLRQLNSVSQDGVPGVTQCPIAPGESLTYSFRATQYGSTWYHSHFTLQYSEGLYGGLIINGPATADYDEDLGVLFLDDWSHTDVFSLWFTARQGGPPVLENGLVNGSNTYDCAASNDTTCSGTLGSKFETVFESGKKYLLRLINVATDGHFQFSIDGHSLTVVANDLVPIQPYVTDSVAIAIAQRYDVIVEANADADNYYLRAGWVSACSTNLNEDNITGIVRYDSSSTEEPTSISTVVATTSCGDEPYESLVPYLSLDVGTLSDATESFERLNFTFDIYFKWTLNNSSFNLDWSTPTLVQILEAGSTGLVELATDYNAVSIDSKSSDEWALLLIEDDSGLNITHPIHLHGHDFYVVGQATGSFDGDVTALNTANPPRRDVASLPGGGYLALAFKLDNPGTWLTHCHIAWHQSEGLSLQIVENKSQLTDFSAVTSAQKTTLEDTCDAWINYVPTMPFVQDDSGI